MTLRARVTQMQRKLGSQIEQWELREFFASGRWPTDASARCIARAWVRCRDDMVMTIPLDSENVQRGVERRYEERQRLVDEVMENDRPFDDSDLPLLSHRAPDTTGAEQGDEEHVHRLPQSPFQASTPSQT